MTVGKSVKETLGPTVMRKRVRPQGRTVLRPQRKPQATLRVFSCRKQIRSGLPNLSQMRETISGFRRQSSSRGPPRDIKSAPTFCLPGTCTADRERKCLCAHNHSLVAASWSTGDRTPPWRFMYATVARLSDRISTSRPRSLGAKWRRYSPWERPRKGFDYTLLYGTTGERRRHFVKQRGRAVKPQPSRDVTAATSRLRSGKPRAGRVVSRELSPIDKWGAPAIGVEPVKTLSTPDTGRVISERAD
ncbi:hypothetical protein DPEC_G00373400 [Dallia pectoralis]|nr:hypothetical protein DPEC_G00373400 [Dallia pectoralis]